MKQLKILEKDKIYILVDNKDKAKKLHQDQTLIELQYLMII